MEPLLDKEATPPPAYYSVQPSASVPATGARVVYVVPAQSSSKFNGHIILALMVTLCCGCLPGLVALALAFSARDNAVTSPVTSRRLAVASVVVSVCAIVAGVAVIVIVLCLRLSPTYCQGPCCPNCRHDLYGSDYCYAFSSNVVQCDWGVRRSSVCYHKYRKNPDVNGLCFYSDPFSGCCYFN